MKSPIVGMLIIAALVFAGCADNNKNPEAAPPDESGKIPANVVPEPDPYARSAPANNTGGGDAMAAGGASDDTIQPISETGKGQSKRTHTVKKGDTLFSISRQYYGNSDGWKKIYDANKTRITDKDKLTVGMKLIIP